MLVETELFASHKSDASSLEGSVFIRSEIERPVLGFCDEGRVELDEDELSGKREGPLFAEGKRAARRPKEAVDDSGPDAAGGGGDGEESIAVSSGILGSAGASRSSREGGLPIVEN